MTVFALIAVVLILAKCAAQLWLNWLNQKYVLAHAGAVPEVFKDIIDEPTYKKSIEYTLAKARLDQIETTYGAVVLLIVLFSGLLPWAFNWFAHQFGTPAWSMAAFLFAIGMALSLPDLPLEWYSQFRLEQRFGFNTTTLRLWLMDRLKGLLLALILGYPLLILLLKLVQWTGESWWLWGWAAMLSFQLLMSVLAPVLILPLFNKFTPLAEGSLRDRLLQLAVHHLNAAGAKASAYQRRGAVTTRSSRWMISSDPL
jgi:STE24 endopeptidase